MPSLERAPSLCQMPDPRAAIPDGSTIETVFKVVVHGDLTNGQRDVLTRSFIRTVTQVTGRQVLVVAHQEIIGPENIVEGPKDIASGGPP